VLGRRGSFRVWLGPLSYARYLEFLPDQEDTRVLSRLIRLFAPDHLDYQLGLRVKKVPKLKLATKGATASRARLGYTSWLHSKAPAATDEETVLFEPDSLSAAQSAPTKEEAA
jgi:predicted component of type VI protein secretion system